VELGDCLILGLEVEVEVVEGLGVLELGLFDEGFFLVDDVHEGDYFGFELFDDFGVLH
jgi:hypothetical protein